ncbi:putative bulb-type lectin domain-containing protein [Rosa chinensis]|uniref:Putative bulb-type lectin domain-containing protein n=1 Tax=Rosa chinensis TaxID=74649 RepID=A0A2P6QA30_ROSCH|nr:putative bulb-type lectin domain-containing protein [Rosa chinensis]
MVLYDSKGKSVWQSFDYPTDTLLVGQSLRAGGVNKLVSRASREGLRGGLYSFILEPKVLFLYYKSNNSPKPLLYSQLITIQKGSLDHVKLNSATDDGYVWDLTLESSARNAYVGGPKFNGTLTYLRLGIDGNIRLHAYHGQGNDSGVKDATLHLVDLDWEILVVDEPNVNVFCLPGGKIVVFIGLLKNFRSDICRYSYDNWS